MAAKPIKSHFRVAANLVMKARLSAKFFIFMRFKATRKWPIYPLGPVATKTKTKKSVGYIMHKIYVEKLPRY